MSSTPTVGAFKKDKIMKKNIKYFQEQIKEIESALQKLNEGLFGGGLLSKSQDLRKTLGHKISADEALKEAKENLDKVKYMKALELYREAAEEMDTLLPEPNPEIAQTA